MVLDLYLFSVQLGCFFIATACYSLWVSYSKPILEPMCVQLNQSLLHNAESNISKDLISILSQNENETVIIMPCDGSVVDEAGNVYRLKGPFELKCDDYITFNYVTGCHVWHGDKCSKDPSWPSWPHRNGSATAEEYHFPECGFNIHCRFCHICDTMPIQLQLYDWVETSSYFTINDIPLNQTVVSLTVNPSTDAKYSLWRNESGIFIRTANWLYMQDTVFNYLCKITNPRPSCWANPNFVGMNDVSGMPLISSCKTLVKLPAHIIGADVNFCMSLIAVHNNESNTYGVKSDGPGCMIKVEEDVIQFLRLSEGSYRFF
jgi:hypothetical protein